MIAGAAAALAVGGAGAGVAATKLATNSPSEESKAIVNDAAKNLGVEPSKLSAALKKAYEDRIDAAVAAGRLTKEQGAELKQRIESGDFPLLGPPGFGHGPGGPHGFFHGLDAAASYLGLTEDQLHSQLESGKTLAEVAKAQGKSVDGLEGRDGQGRQGAAGRRRQGGSADLGARSSRSSPTSSSTSTTSSTASCRSRHRFRGRAASASATGQGPRGLRRPAA